VSALDRIDVGVVLGAGRELDVRQSLSIPDFGTYSFPAPAEVALNVRRLGLGIELEGTVDVAATGQCSRCLDDVRLPLHLEIDERLDPNRERDDPFSENNVLVGDQLDLADLVRQVIDSALPLVLHCRDDCTGLCPTCGNPRDGACGCPKTPE